jgi:cytochrome c oxidase subunit II
VNELLRRLLLLPPQASAIAREVDYLHYSVISVTMAASMLVALVALVFLLRYRRRGSLETATTARVRSSSVLEVGVVGSVLVLFLLWWVVGFRLYVKMETPPPDTLDVYVTGKQWMWKFAYADGVNAASQLTVPAGRPVRLIMTSRGVIHSFYVPALRMKQDVIPGRYVTLWFNADLPGSYPIYCAEYCGVSHSGMLGSLLVLPEAEYARWHDVASEGRALSSGGRPTEATDRDAVVPMAVRGSDVAVRHACVACHTLDGQRTLGPTWRSLYLSQVLLTDGRTIVADEAYLTKSMMEPGADIVTGYQNAMPTYEGTLDQGEVAALVELIKSVRTGSDGSETSGVSLPVLETKP